MGSEILNRCGIPENTENMEPVRNRRERRAKRMMDTFEKIAEELMNPENFEPITIDVKIVLDEDGKLKGLYDEDLYLVSRYSEQPVVDSLKPDQVWRCILDERGRHVKDIIPIMKLGDAAEPVDSPVESDMEPTDEEEEVDFQAMEITRLESENSELKAVNSGLQRSYNLSKNEIQQLNESMDSLKEENKRLIRANESLARQVQILNRKNSSSIIEGLQNERDILKRELEELKASLKGDDEGSGESEGVLKTPKLDTVILTGPTGIHSTLLRDGRYRVRFNPMRRCLVFKECEDGEIVCRNNEVHIPGLKGFSEFVKIRTLRHIEAEDGLLVQLN